MTQSTRAGLLGHSTPDGLVRGGTQEKGLAALTVKATADVLMSDVGKRAVLRVKEQRHFQ